MQRLRLVLQLLAFGIGALTLALLLVDPELAIGRGSGPADPPSSSEPRN